MNKLMNKLIKKIVTEFGKAHIHWGIGGSQLLKFYGITETVNDLDLLIALEDIDAALLVLDSLGKRIEIPHKSEYITESFTRFQIDGIEVDVMANFKIEHEAGIYDFQFDKSTKVKTVIVDEVPFPLTSLEEWYIAYLLMKDRDSKVGMIEAYLLKQKQIDLGLLMNRMHQGIPIEVLLRINRLVIEVRESMDEKELESHPYDGLYKD